MGFSSAGGIIQSAGHIYKMGLGFSWVLSWLESCFRKLRFGLVSDQFLRWSRSFLQHGFGQFGSIKLASSTDSGPVECTRRSFTLKGSKMRSILPLIPVKFELKGSLASEASKAS